jgi:general secretion pathway protein H
VDALAGGPGAGKGGGAAQRGFTLIELLVVLLVMGLLVGMISATVRPDGRALLQIEAERLALLLDLAATESRLSGRSVALGAEAGGYRFWRLGADTEWSEQSAGEESAQWVEIRDGDIFRARSLPPDMAIAGLWVEGRPVDGAWRLAFPPYGTAPAFSIELALADGISRYAVASSPVGEIQVFSAEGKSGD